MTWAEAKWLLITSVSKQLVKSASGKSFQCSIGRHQTQLTAKRRRLPFQLTAKLRQMRFVKVKEIYVYKPDKAPFMDAGHIGYILHAHRLRQPLSRQALMALTGSHSELTRAAQPAGVYPPAPCFRF